MSNLDRKDMVCGSLYHMRWFRIILFIVSVDMLIFGVLFAIGIDMTSFIPNMPIILHIIIGSLYVIVSIFIFHLIFSYKRIKKDVYFVCHKCGHVNNE